jgi:hypothetical protein
MNLHELLQIQKDALVEVADFGIFIRIGFSIFLGVLCDEVPD